MWSDDFDYNGMLMMFRKALAGGMSLPDMELLSRSMEDVNYHADNRKLRAKIDEAKGGDGKAGKLMVRNKMLAEIVLQNTKYATQALGTSFNKATEAITYLDRAEAAFGKSDPLVAASMQQIDVVRVAIKKVEKMIKDLEQKVQ
jgi:hypothetical protein